MRSSRHLRGDRAVLVLLFSVMFASATEALIMTPLLPQMATELSIDVEVAAQWITAYVATTALFALIFGPISDHIGRRIILLWGMALLCAGTLLIALSNSFWTLLACRVISGAGSGLLVTSTTSFVGDHFEHQHRATAMSHVMNGGLSAFILGIPLGAYVAAWLGWKNMFVALAATLFALLLLLHFLLPPPRAARRSERLEINYLQLLKVRPLWGVFGMMATNGISMTMYSVYLSAWMADQFGFLTHHRGLVYAIGGPGILIGAPIAGKLSGRFGRIPVALAGTVCVAITVGLMPWTRALGTALASEAAPRFGGVSWPETIPLFACAFFVLLGGATRGGPLHTFALEQVASDKRGSVAAMGNSFFQSGSAAGAALGGLLWVAFERDFAVICAIAALLNVIAGVLLYALSWRKSAAA